MHSPQFDGQTNKCRKLYSNELQTQFQKLDIARNMTKRRLLWAGYA